MTTPVKVAAFRNATDHLFQLANVDYHACVSAREIGHWKDIAACVLAASEGLECRRATAHDRQRFTQAVDALKTRLQESDRRIAQLQVSGAPVSSTQPASGTQPPQAQPAPTAAQLEHWAGALKYLATRLQTARQFARCERQRVDAYVLQIFQSFEFVDADGQKIQQPRDLYLCEDEAACTAFYDRCYAAHRAHGFTGPEGHCPALTAETAVIAQENVLLTAGCQLLGFTSMPSALFGRQARTRMLELLMTACLGEGYRP